MKTPSYTTAFLVDQTPEQAFAAIKNVRAWWSGEIHGKTERLGDEFTYRYEDMHRSTQTIVELVPDQKIVWRVSDGYLKFTEDTHEWDETQLSFEVSKKGEKTEVRFTHIGLIREHECFDKCTNAWAFYIHESLKPLITTGKGQPNV
jgi:hypothetical protein